MSHHSDQGAVIRVEDDDGLSSMPPEESTPDPGSQGWYRVHRGQHLHFFYAQGTWKDRSPSKTACGLKGKVPFDSDGISGKCPKCQANLGKAKGDA